VNSIYWGNRDVVRFLVLTLRAFALLDAPSLHDWRSTVLSNLRQPGFVTWCLLSSDSRPGLSG